MTRSAPSGALLTLGLALRREQRAVLVGELDHPLGVARAQRPVAVLDALHRRAGLLVLLLVLRVVEDLLRCPFEEREAIGELLDHLGMDRPRARGVERRDPGAEDLVHRRRIVGVAPEL